MEEAPLYFYGHVDDLVLKRKRRETLTPLGGLDPKLFSYT